MPNLRSANFSSFHHSQAKTDRDDATNNKIYIFFDVILGDLKEVKLTVILLNLTEPLDVCPV